MKRMIAFLFVLSAIAPAPMTAYADEKKDDKPPYYLTDEELDKKLDIDEKTESPKTFVWVAYFHRVPGCDTCQLMSKYVCETVDTNFKDDAKAKELVLRYRNFEEQKNADLVKKLKIKSPSLVIMIVKDGKPVKAKLAGKIWSLAADKKKFIEYVTEEINAYKKEVEEGKK